jgi:phenylacetic acid degradation operon negative regulatory protein
MSLKRATEHLVSEFSSRPTVRAGSLIVSLFGDAILPRGGTVWIGSLIRALADFGINERLVRTSVFRLTKENWLNANQVGRRSYYSLSDVGARKFEQATIRIYGDPRQDWNGDWCLVLLADLSGEMKETIRKELGWLGFGAISTNVLAHPTPNTIEMEATLTRAGVDNKVVAMRGRTLGQKQDVAMRSLVHKSWNLDEIDSRYENFVSQFRPVTRSLQKSHRPDPRLAFQIRTLLIQEYRSILLRDPLLPAELLPKSWNGTAAYRACRELYQLIYESADQYLTTEFENTEGSLPTASKNFYDRFGGLNKSR